jgi:GNAT superfamily N-acetyltransferase
MIDEVVLERATPADVERATACAAAAFAQDPLMHFFFDTSPAGVGAASERFFSILMRARLALGMPAVVARTGSGIVGLTMGYDTAPPEWPGEFTREWEAFEAGIPGVAGRFEAYERVAGRFRPEVPHYYLGVIAVDPGLKGKGLGRRLLEDFCARSFRDEHSVGVYLETGSTDSLAFYLRNGFVLRGQEDLGGTPLWCVFAPHGPKGQLP